MADGKGLVTLGNPAAPVCGPRAQIHEVCESRVSSFTSREEVVNGPRLFPAHGRAGRPDGAAPAERHAGLAPGR